MRYTEEHKQQTYEKIVTVASHRFRENGFNGVSIGQLMSELDLTHGGFYRHFSDKENLYIETIAYSIREVQDNIMDQISATGEPTLRKVITNYLSMEHCENVGSGCPVAALSSEIPHQSDKVQNAFEQGLHIYMERFLPLIQGDNEDERTNIFLVLFSGMAGALSVARAITDPELKKRILDSSREFYIQTYCE